MGVCSVPHSLAYFQLPTILLNKVGSDSFAEVEEEPFFGCRPICEKWKDPRLAERYGRFIFEAIDETLETILGKTGKEIAYACMRHGYDLNVENCYRNIRGFTRALGEIFGDDVAIVIEKMVANKLRTSLNLKDMNEDASLAELFERLRKTRRPAEKTERSRLALKVGRSRR